MTCLKKIVSLILCIAVMTMGFAAAASADGYVVGDADGDGDVTVLDATLIQRVLALLVRDDDGMIALRGDSNRDGLDILDATRIQRFLAGYISSLTDETSAPTEAPTNPSTDSEGWDVIIYRP